REVLEAGRNIRGDCTQTAERIGRGRRLHNGGRITGEPGSAESWAGGHHDHLARFRQERVFKMAVAVNVDAHALPALAYFFIFTKVESGQANGIGRDVTRRSHLAVNVFVS